jgi:glycosyltransferase involved in cell wall biosynthesis
MNTPAGGRLLHVTECLAGGTLAFLVLATRLLAERGVRQTLLFSRRADTPEKVEAMFDPSVEMIELPRARRLHWTYFKSLRAHLSQQFAGDDLIGVHFHSSKAGFFGRMALVGLNSKVPAFYSPHGLSFLDRRFLLPALLFEGLERLAARVDTALVGCSRGEAQLLTRVGQRDAVVLENAVDDVFFDIRRREAKPLHVVTIGRVCRQKAPERFAELAARFQIAEIDARFVWIGGGDPIAEARLRAAGVQVTGWVEREEVRRQLSEAAVYVQTSRWEGMPLSVLQALAAGVPCVVTDVVGNRDAVDHGQTGYIARTMDEMALAVNRLLTDETARKRQSQAAREQALRRFSQESFAARLGRLYGLDSADGDEEFEHEVPKFVTSVTRTSTPRQHSVDASGSPSLVLMRQR